MERIEIRCCWAEYRGFNARVVDQRGKEVEPGQVGVFSVERLGELNEKELRSWRRVKGEPGTFSTRRKVLVISEEDAKVEEPVKGKGPIQKAKLFGLSTIDAIHAIRQIEDEAELRDVAIYEERRNVKVAIERQKEALSEARV